MAWQMNYHMLCNGCACIALCNKESQAAADFIQARADLIRALMHLMVCPLQYQTNPIGGGLCWNGRTVSRGAVVGSAIASFLILFFIILAALAFVRRRQRTTQSVRACLP